MRLIRERFSSTNTLCIIFTYRAFLQQVFHIPIASMKKFSFVWFLFLIFFRTVRGFNIVLYNERGGSKPFRGTMCYMLPDDWKSKAVSVDAKACTKVFSQAHCGGNGTPLRGKEPLKRSLRKAIISLDDC